ncbi:hypothetical protein [Pseudomonas viridiflava]|uniref:hypothetical protein n=1 Tax=Pseudomonas viridiflava TaxID=33069 RepID=UPI000F02B542|nr:hypothetical protein [Pseudomonas viridiflava]
MSDPRMMLNALVHQLGAYAYRYSSEVRLHEAMAIVLTNHGFTFERERILDKQNRADFWLDGIVIEVKVDGSIGEALRQVDRYIKLPDVKGVILAGTPRWASENLDDKPEWNGKPFRMVRLARQAL